MTLTQGTTQGLSPLYMCTGGNYMCTDENENFFIKSAMFLTKIGVFSSNQLYFHYGCTDENSILRHSLH